MVILGIETSCDETAAAIVEGPNEKGRVKILSNVISSTPDLLAKYGGVLPEQTARRQLESIIPVIQETLQQAQCQPQGLDAIAVTQGPGLIGSLLIGVETAKVLSVVWNKPLIPVNHLLGHFYANWIQDLPKFPNLGLLVSGGHTDLVLFTDHGKYQYLGGTRDDAAGECFDKSARALGLPFPGGPALAQQAQMGNPNAYKLPRPMINSGNFDFSFSGLKTAVINLLELVVQMKSEKLTPTELCDLCASIEAAIVDTLVKKTIKAAQRYQVEQIMVAGGVAANQTLKKNLAVECRRLKIPLHIPTPTLCTDNAAMIGSFACIYPQIIDPTHLEANPNLSLDNETSLPLD